MQPSSHDTIRYIGGAPAAPACQARPLHASLKSLRSAQVQIPAAVRSVLEKTAFEIGWDFGHYAVEPSPAWTSRSSDLAEGYAAARKHFHGRALSSDPFIRKWLRVRASAIMRGRVCHETVTPTYLRSIAPRFCPITRQQLSYSLAGNDIRGADSLWTVDRLNNDAGYIAGNLVVMSQKANLAKADLGFRELRALAMRTDDGRPSSLSKDEWGRLAYLSSLTVSTKNWREAAMLPMLAVVPSGVYLSHSVAAMQLKLAQSPWCSGMKEGCAAWAKRFKGKHLQKSALRVAEAYYVAVQVEHRRQPGHLWQWVAADAWKNAALFDLWRRLVDALDDTDMHALVPRDHLSTKAVAEWCDAAGLANAGYIA